MAVSAGTSSVTPFAALVAANDGFVNGSIASGPPTTFSVVMTKMSLVGARPDGPATELPIFDEPLGKAITITGDRVDLSNMFTHYECIDNHGEPYALAAGESCACGFDEAGHPLGKVADPSSGNYVCPYDLKGYTGGRGSGGTAATMTADVGSYASLIVEFQRQAKVSGCVTGNYGAPGSTISGTHRYCTRAEHAFMAGAGGGQNPDFEGQAPEEMDFDLVAPGSGGGTSDSVRLEFPIDGGLKVSASESAALTLTIDVNRMLRFYNQAVVREVNPGAPSTISFFFTSVFNSSVFVFAGASGKVQGYALVADACLHGTGPACAASQPVATWLTLFRDAGGAPFAASFMPDDDDALTVMKGVTLSTDGERYFWDRSLLVQDGDGKYDITYHLGTDSGTLLHLDVDAAVGASLSDVSFVGYFNSSGAVAARREL